MPSREAWVTTEIHDLCDKKRELKNKRDDANGARKYGEVNNEIKKRHEESK